MDGWLGNSRSAPTRSLAFIFHIALELPLALQGAFAPLSLPLLDVTNTTVVFIKVRWSVHKTRDRRQTDSLFTSFTQFYFSHPA